MMFVITLYRKQIKEGRVFLHEHPAHATSWSMREVKKLAQTQGVLIYEADQCMYGLTTRSKGNRSAKAMKPTSF